MTNLIILIFNALLYVLLFSFYCCKKRKFDLGSIILGLWMLVALISIHAYYEPAGWAPYRDMSFFPCLYLFASVFIVSLPILTTPLGQKKSILIFPSKRRMMLVSLLLSIIYFIAFIYLILYTDFSLSSLFSASDIIANYNESELNSSSIYLITSICSFIVPIFFMYNLMVKNRFLSIAMLFSIIVSILLFLQTSSRLYILKIIFAILFAYFAFRGEFSKRQRQIVRIGIGIPTIIIIVGFIFITFARFSSARYDILHYIEFYLTNGMLYFNGYGLDSGGIRFGDRNFMYLKRMLGLDWVSHSDLNTKYAYMEMDDSLFTTFVGEFTLDIGYVAIVFFILLSIFCLYTCRLRNGQLPFYVLLILSVPFQLSSIGFALNNVSELYVVFIIILYLSLYIKFDIYGKSASHSILSSPVSSNPRE